MSAEEKNPRGIPKAPFIADVEQHIGGPDAEVESALKKLQDALAKYRYMEANLAQRRRGLEEKIPDIKKTLQMVEFLQQRREGKTEDDEDEDLNEESDNKTFKTTFELNDTLFAEAEIEDTDLVYLWLGANVMLSYKIPEAITLLKSKLEAANTGLQTNIEDSEYIKEQITVMEVNVARVYNWDVVRRRERRLKAEGDKSEGG